MKYITLTLFSALLISVGNGDIHQMNFYEDTLRENSIFGNALFDLVTSSLSLCTAKCNLMSTCYGVSLHVVNKNCRGYDRFASPSTVQGTKVWKKVLRCHPHYTYTASVDVCWKWYGGSWFEGMVTCAEEDSRLVVLDTVDKLESLRQAINSANENYYYWVGGQFVSGTWKWLDGTPVEMTSTFWGPGEPNRSPSHANVLGWNTNTHGKFDDGVGNSNNRHICEKP